MKRNKLAPNQNLTNKKAKTDRKFKKITYSSGGTTDAREMQEGIAKCTPYS